MATLFAAGMVGDLSDAQLVERYLGGRDAAARAAFEALVDRHGPMVLRVCRQALRGNAHDAQDVFQATFLILARKAGSVRHRESVASWLHGVALRVAARSRSDAERRRLRERSAASRIEPASAPSEAWPELHEELARLPTRFREPIVLCYLEGLSTEAAALRLGCPRGTVLSRLSRGRDHLRHRLARRGLDPSFIAIAAARIPDAALPAELVGATARISIGFARGRVVDLALVSGSSLTLARGMLHAMNLSKLSAIAAATLAGAVGLQGARTYAVPDGRQEPAATQPSRAEARSTPVPDDPPTSPEKLRAELAESKRAEAAMKRELDQLRKQVQFNQSLMSANPGFIPRDPSPAGYFPLGIGSRIIVESSRAGKGILYDSESKERHEFEVTDAKDGPAHQILPITAPSVVGLEVRGPRIVRVAAALPREGGWYTQDLREPLDGKAIPIVGVATVVYSIGSHVYAFSAEARRWDVVDLPDGVIGEPRIGLQNSVHLMIPGHTWIFNGKTGLWSHLDLKEILKDPGPARP